MAEVKMPEDINISDYPSNSNKSKQKQNEPNREKKIQKVVSNDVTIKKKGFFSRFKHSMMSEDANTVGEYVVKDIVVPMVKDLIFNVAQGALNMVLYGNNSIRPGLKNNVPYNSISTKSGVYRYNSQNLNTNGTNSKMQPIDYFNVNNFGFQTKADAEKVLAGMRMILEDYPSVSIHDFYDLSGITAPHTANDYGWTDLRFDIKSVNYMGRWYLDLPPYKSIKP